MAGFTIPSPMPNRTYETISTATGVALMQPGQQQCAQQKAAAGQ